MADSALEAVLRRDRAVVLASLMALTALAWGYLLWLAQTMSMAGAPQPWGAAGFAFMFLMWAVMMVGMMTPSAAPMILLYARVGRQAAARGRPLAATGFFAGGYLLAWTVFSVAATLGQWLLVRSHLLTSAMSSNSRLFGGLVLIAAAIYQWSSLKRACLLHCRAPLSFIQQHGGFRREAAGSLALGLRHGAYCTGCCWALMVLLFVVGVMNLGWVALLATIVLMEKLVPARWRLDQLLGLVLLTAGIVLLGTKQFPLNILPFS